MNYEKIEQYPLKVWKEINDLKEKLVKISVSLNSEFSYDSTFDAVIGTFSGPHKSYFQVHFPTVDSQNKVKYKLGYKPRNRSSNAAIEAVVEQDAIERSLLMWSKLVMEFDTEIKRFSDPYYAQAEREIEEMFPPEPNDDVEAYPITAQGKIRHLLTYIEVNLAEENTDSVEVQSLIQASAELKEKVDTLPRLAVKKAITKILTGIKKHGKKTFKKVMDELTKRAINFGLDEAQKLIDTIIS